MRLCSFKLGSLGFPLLCLLSLGSICSAQVAVHVAPDGNDAASGSEAAPLATLEAARDRIRALDPVPEGGVVVWIHGGVYERGTTFELEGKDSGTVDGPVAYRSRPGQNPVFLFGKQIPTEAWKPLSEAAQGRVHPDVEVGSLVELEYDALGILNGDRLSGSDQSANAPESFVLFANGLRQLLAQWPNSEEKVSAESDPGWATPNGTRDNFSFFFGRGGKPSDGSIENELDLDGTNRSKRWKSRLDSGNDLWLRGHWRTPWAPRLSLVAEMDLDGHWIKLASVPPGGMGSKYSSTFEGHDGEQYRTGSGTERYYAINLLEEIDRPGEYAIDFEDRRVYFYPPANLDELEITVADTDLPIIKVSGAEHIQFDRLVFRGGLGSGIVMEDCHHVAIRGCEIDGIGQHGIVVTGGTHHRIQSNDIRETGHSGISISKVGDRKRLVAGGSVITNNYVSHTGKVHFDCGAIQVDSVIGIKVSHNLIHHTPSRGYEHRNDNDVLFEYNEIHNCALQTSDTGATYTHGKWSTYGNVFRYNFIHHNQRANGFYCDDGDSGDVHRFNIIHQCIDALKFGGGHDNIAEHNLLIQNEQQRTDDRGVSRNYRLGTRYESELRAFAPEEEPWLSYGKQLREEFGLTTDLWSDVLDPEWLPELPHGSRCVNNVTVESSNWQKPRQGDVIIANNVEVGSVEAAEFYDFDNMDLRSDHEVILGVFPDLNTVFPKMGLQEDEFRTVIPTRKSVGGLGNFGGTVEGEEDADLDRKR